jgi:hypothetical protein
MYQFPESHNASVGGTLQVDGSAVVELGRFDAICSFTYCKMAEVVEAFLDEGDDEGDDEDNPLLLTSLNKAQIRTQQALSKAISTLTLASRTKPRASGILSTNFCSNRSMQSVSTPLTTNIPSKLLAVLDSADFQQLDMRLQNDASTQNEWEIVFLHVNVRLQGLSSALNLLAPFITFDIPTFNVLVHYPTDATKRAYTGPG